MLATLKKAQVTSHSGTTQPKVFYDPSKLSYETLVDYFWRHIDPTDAKGQFCDKGNAYIPVIYARPDLTAQAKASKADIIKTKPFSDPIVVPVLPAKTFWDAEGYHQDYYKKNPEKPFCERYITPKLDFIFENYRNTLIVSDK